jgi:hypothetical protein
MRKVEGRDPEELLPDSIEEPLSFQENKAYVREVLASQTDLTAKGANFVPIGKLPSDHRYFAYQAVVNEGGVPSEEVIEKARRQLGEDYRLETEGPHPVSGLVREDDRDGATTEYATKVAA